MTPSPHPNNSLPPPYAGLVAFNNNDTNTKTNANNIQQPPPPYQNLQNSNFVTGEGRMLNEKQRAPGDSLKLPQASSAPVVQPLIRTEEEVTSLFQVSTHVFSQ